MGTRAPVALSSAGGADIRRTRLLAHALYALARTRPSRAGARSHEVRSAVHVSPALFGADGIMGGGERSAYELAHAVARKMPTTLVSFGRRRASERDGDLLIEIYPAVKQFEQSFDPLSNRFLGALARADVVHCNQYRVAVAQIAILATAALGKRAFVTDRGGVGLHFDPSIPVERCLTAALPMSEFSRGLLPDAVPAQVIRGGTTERFLSGIATSGEDDAPDRRVLYVGRIMRHKGIDALVEGLPEGLGLDVVGRVYDEPYHELLVRLARGRNVRFIHDADDERLRRAYLDALVTVLPSVYRDVFGGLWEMPELLGNVLLESMACGTPAICTDVGGMPEVVEHGVTGFVVPPNDPSAIGRRIAELAADPALRAAMGRRGRDHVEREFTWELAASSAVEAYRREWS